jgi:hypothetical protein
MGKSTKTQRLRQKMRERSQVFKANYAGESARNGQDLSCQSCACSEEATEISATSISSREDQMVVKIGFKLRPPNAFDRLSRCNVHENSQDFASNSDVDIFGKCY